MFQLNNHTIIINIIRKSIEIAMFIIRLEDFCDNVLFSSISTSLKTVFFVKKKTFLSRSLKVNIF